MAEAEMQYVRVRAFHHKSKNGCLTCKKRKIRCDEGKPSCKKCLTSGRRCDGYSSPPPETQPPRDLARSRKLAPAPGARSMMPGKDPLEVESFQYFINVAAPSIAGTFDSDFWLREIPQFSIADPAIWHAVTAFGSLCRNYDFTSADPCGKNIFALRQSNAAIKLLTERKPISSGADQWRALVASTIFASMSVVQGSFEQAQVHFLAGLKIFQEIQNQERKMIKTRPTNPRMAPPTPVKASSVRSILIAFSIHEQRLEVSEVVGAPTISPEDDSFGLWRIYTSPGSLLSNVTPENLMEAIRAGESLFFGLIYFVSINLMELTALMKSGQIQLPSLASRQRLHLRCYREVEKTFKTFKEVLDSGIFMDDWTAGTRAQMEKGVKHLQIFYLVTRMMFHKDPEEPNPVKRLMLMPDLCKQVVDLVEEVLDMEQANYGRQEGTIIIPSPPITQPLAWVIQAGFGYATRRRGIELLRRPRLEGIWDTLMSASLVEVALDLEVNSCKEYWARKTREGVVFKPIATGTGIEEIETGAHPLCRLFAVAYSHRTQRTAKFALRTWQQWIDNEPGRWITAEW